MTKADIIFVGAMFCILIFYSAVQHFLEKEERARIERKLDEMKEGK